MGLFIVGLLALGITLLAQLPFFESIKLSAIALGVVVGMLLANTIRPLFPKQWDGGLALASKHFLRTGIVLYGFKLTLNALFVMGPKAVAIDCIVVCGTLLLGNALGRWLKLDKDERLLISSGSAICGAAAVLATEPVLQAPKHKRLLPLQRWFCLELYLCSSTLCFIEWAYSIVFLPKPLVFTRALPFMKWRMC